MWIGKHSGPMPTRQDVCKDASTFQADPKWQIIFETFPMRKYGHQYPNILRFRSNPDNDSRCLTGKSTAEDALKKAEEEVNKILTQ